MRKLILICLVFASSQLMADAPNIAPVLDQQVMQGTTYTYQLQLQNDEHAQWIKTYGPDSVQVNPITGKLVWDIASDLPDESFHLGVKAVNQEGFDEQTWILTVGDGNVLYIGPDETIKTLKDGMAAIEPGDTLVMRNGVWDHNDTKNTIPGSPNKFQFLEGGDETQYTTLIAEDPGQVIIDGNNEAAPIRVFGSYAHPDFPPSGSSFSGNTSYYAIKGLVLQNSPQESLRVEYSHHVKLINIGVGSSAKGQDSYANVYIHKSRYVLIEGMYVWGHGRYKIQFKNSSEGVVRRSVVRVDDYDGDEPLGAYISYCAKNIVFQNNLVVDSDQSHYWLDFYELTNAFGVAATNCYDYPLGNIFTRNLSLNTHMGLMKADVRNTLEPTIWENIVGWDMKPDRQAGGTGGGVPVLSGVAVTESNNITMGDVLLDGGNGADFYLYSRDDAETLTSTVQDSILYRLGWNGTEIENRGNLIRNTGSEFNFLNNNIFGFTGELVQAGSVNEADTTNIDPEYQYITHLPRDSQLTTMSSNGNHLGAEVMTLIGESGTYYNEPGYDQETNLPMWPFPNERIAHQHMSAFSVGGLDRNGNSDGITGERGFAVPEQTLTNYVWGYLGATVPPFNVSATEGNHRILLTWTPSASSSQSTLSTYKIYQKNNDQFVFLDEVPATTYKYVITELENNQAYEFAVTAVNQENEESDYAYAVEATPTEGIKPQAPVLSLDDE